MLSKELQHTYWPLAEAIHARSNDVYRSVNYSNDAQDVGMIDYKVNDMNFLSTFKILYVNQNLSKFNI